MENLKLLIQKNAHRLIMNKDDVEYKILLNNDEHEDSIDNQV